MKHASANPRIYRAAARTALFYSSNWIAALITTYAVPLLTFTAVFLTDSGLALLSALLPIPTAVDAVLYLAWYLLLSPLAVGLLCYYTDLFRAAHGDGSSHVPSAVIFSPYASLTSIIRAWAFSFLTLLLCALIPASLAPLFYSCRLLLSSQAVLPAIPMMLGGVILFLASLYFNARLTPALYLSSARPELSFGSVVRRTWQISQNTAVTAVLLQLELLAAGVLSLLLTAGIVFFIWLLPTAIFTYVGYCHELSHRCDLL